MKENIRNRLKKQRADLSLALLNDLSKSIANTVRKSKAFQNADNIGFYYSVRGEADPSSLISTATTDKHFFLPVLSKNKDEGLVFIELDEETQLQNNKFGIPEPRYDKERIVKANTLDLVITPLLAFDKNGNRLGMGGGFYDRCFSFKKDGIIKPLLMGYAYSFQEVESIETEPWDIGLDMIAIENTLIIPEHSNVDKIRT